MPTALLAANSDLCPSTHDDMRALARELEVALLRWRALLCDPSAPSALRRLAPLLAPMRAVELRALPNEDLAVFEGERLLLDDAYPHHACARYADPRERLIHALLYATHEVIHHAHNLNGKRLVRKMRAVSEERLMEFDLEADHHAAVEVSRLLGEELLGLKRRQVECLSSFPVTAAHTPAARLRKAGRYVSLCAEVRARELGALEEEGGFLMALWGGGEALLLERAGLGRLLFEGALSEEERALFESSMDAAPEEVFTARRASVEGALARAWGLPLSA